MVAIKGLKWDVADSMCAKNFYSNSMQEYIDGGVKLVDVEFDDEMDNIKIRIDKSRTITTITEINFNRITDTMTIFNCDYIKLEIGGCSDINLEIGGELDDRV